MTEQEDRKAASKLPISTRVTDFLFAEGESYRDYREDDQAVFRTMSTYSVPSLQFLLISTIATAIATFGLLANSTVVIVGAMLVAPLMKPILSISYSVVTADRRMGTRALLTLILGVMVAMTISSFLESAIGLGSITSEIVARTRPSMIDLGIAIAAGFAAGMATVRKNVADSLPGVAIAVALLPPLCASGIGLSLGLWDVALGAALLFGVNLIAIVLSVNIVLMLNGFGRLRQAGAPLIMILLMAAGVGVPLDQALRELKVDDTAQVVVEKLLHEDYKITGAIHPNDLSRLDSQIYPEHIFVFLELKSPQGLDVSALINRIHVELTSTMQRPVNLKVQLLMTKEFLHYDYSDEQGNVLDYGAEDIIPRR